MTAPDPIIETEEEPARFSGSLPHPSRWAMRVPSAPKPSPNSHLKFSAYNGADPSEYDTRAEIGSADSVVLGEYEELRDRARERERNDPHVRGMIETLVDNVVGTGIRAQARPDRRALDITDAQANEWSRACEAVFEAAVPHLEMTGRLDFYGMQRLAVARAFVDGDIFVHRASFRNPNSPVATTFEVIESDRVMDPRDVGLASPREIRGGVELGRRHQPVAYWIRAKHPHDYLRGVFTRRRADRDRYIRVPARTPEGRPRILHLYRPERPQQTRGVSHLAPALVHLQHLDDYLVAELAAKRMEACIAFARTQSADRAAPEIPGDNALVSELPVIEPGTIFDMLPGEELKLLDPSRPGNAFADFVAQILKAAGAAVGIPHILFLGDYSQTNYSSYRGAVTDFRLHCGTWHRWLVERMCDPVREAVLMEAWQNGDLPPVPLMDNPKAWLRAEWLTPPREWVDPQKEAAGEKLALESKLRTHAEVLGARGVDWETHYEQLAREQAKREELGLASAAVEPNEPDPPADEPDDETESDDEEVAEE